MRCNRSIFFPLLLIVLGAVFLARDLFPEFYWLRNLHLLWPVLLIVWGVLMLTRRSGMGGPGMRPPDVRNL